MPAISLLFIFFFLVIRVIVAVAVAAAAIKSDPARRSTAATQRRLRVARRGEKSEKKCLQLNARNVIQGFGMQEEYEITVGYRLPQNNYSWL